MRRAFEIAVEQQRAELTQLRAKLGLAKHRAWQLQIADHNRL